MAEEGSAMSNEDKKCVNCDLYGWKQPQDKSVIKRCSGCQMFWYCSELCQKEHWINIHKKQCKYLLAKNREVLPNAKHDESNCLVCKEECKVDKKNMSRPSNPVLPCPMSVANIHLMNNIPVPMGMPSIPLAEMTGKYHSKEDHTVAIMMRILVKMKMTRHVMWRVEKESAEELYGLLGKCRWKVWWRCVAIPKSRMKFVDNEDLAEIDTKISRVVNKMKALSDGDHSVLKPWHTLKVLAAFLQESILSSGRFVADCIGVPELPEEMQSIRMTQAHLNQVWERVLDMLSAGLVPFTRLVVALCDGDPVKLCFQCGEQVTVVDVVASLLCSSQARNYPNLVPALMLDMGFFYSLCGKPSCLLKQSTSRSFNIGGVWRMAKLYGGFLMQYKRERCDYCGWFNQDLRGHRCAGCKTKVYCGVECLNEDYKVHQKLCESGKGEKRKKKRGNEKRLEKGKNEGEKMLNDLDISVD